MIAGLVFGKISLWVALALLSVAGMISFVAGYFRGGEVKNGNGL